ncbi:MAG: chemotaxis protein CheW [Gammaproteobacteria bacterium]|nr:chemotaxis protein CheW [Gammaproteobacteria bacterium]
MVASIEAMNQPNILSETDLQSDAGVVRYGVRVGGLHLLLPSQTLNEVVDEGVIYPVPNTPEWFGGVINHRGNIVSIFDLKGLLFDKETYTSSQNNESQILVIGRGDGAVGILIDALPQAVSLEELEKGGQIDMPAILERHLTSNKSCEWVEVDFSGLFEEIGGLILS